MTKCLYLEDFLEVFFGKKALPRFSKDRRFYLDKGSSEPGVSNIFNVPFRYFRVHGPSKGHMESEYL